MKALLILFSVYLFTSPLFAQEVKTIVSSSSFNDGLAINSKNELFASYYYNSTVAKIQLNGTVSTYATGLSDPNGLTFGYDQLLYIPNAKSNSIVRINADGSKTTIVNSITNPTGLRFRADSSLLIAQYQLNRISILDNQGNLSTFLSNALLNGPVGLDFDEHKNLFIGNFNNGAILKFTPDGILYELARIPSQLGFITYSHGYIYATGFQTNKIYRVHTKTEILDEYVGTGSATTVDYRVPFASFNGPNGIVASNTGDTLFVSEFGSRSLRMITNILPHHYFSTVDSVSFTTKSTVASDSIMISLDNSSFASIRIDSIHNQSILFSFRLASHEIAAQSSNALTIYFNPKESGLFVDTLTLDLQGLIKRIPLKAQIDISTSIESIESIPSRLELNQNYPNPFNPSTNFSIYLPTSTDVELQVYDLNGKLISTIYSGFLQQGNQFFKWNASSLSSGVYMYQLKTNQHKLSKQMLLIK